MDAIFLYKGRNQDEMYYQQHYLKMGLALEILVFHNKFSYRILGFRELG
jgi:hypothetical protein